MVRPRDISDVEKSLTNQFIDICRNHGLAHDIAREFPNEDVETLAEWLSVGGMQSLFTEFIKKLSNGGNAAYEEIVQRSLKKAFIITIREKQKKQGKTDGG